MRSIYAPVALLALSGILTGCSSSFAPGTSTPEQAGLSMVHGVVHGGRQPIVGAHLYALQASTTAYGAASTSVLTSGTTSYPLTLDASGGPTNGFNYVTTDSGGGFQLGVDTNTCTSGSVVYLYGLGGDPGAGANTSAGLLAVLGVCGTNVTGAPGTGYLSETVSGGVDVDEITTVAAAYTLAPFATDALHIGAPSSTDNLALLGINNAAVFAGQLVNLAAGQANQTIPGGSGTIPYKTINTLGNVLAGCINSNGAGSSGCSTIFTNVMSGGTTGTTATDTATAAIYIAQHPAITSYVIPAAIGSPYQPALSAAPNDYTLGIVYPVGNNPLGIAIDGVGNAWVTNNNNNGTPGSTTNGGSVSEISPAGILLSPTGGFTAGGIAQPVGIAIDQSANIWITDTSTTGGVIELTSTGSVAANTPHYDNGALVQPLGVAIDSNGNPWVTDPGQTQAAVVELSSTGGVSSKFGQGYFVEPLSLQFDATGSVWVADYVGDQQLTGSTGGDVLELSNIGNLENVISGYDGIMGPYSVAIDASGQMWAPDSGSSTTAGNSVTEYNPFTGSVNNYSGGGVNGPVSVAIDGSGNVWLGNQGSNTSVSELTNAGNAVSGAAGYTGGGRIAGPGGIAIDGSGNVWIADSAQSSVTELVGAAAPTATPICAGLASGKTPGSKP